MVTSAQCLESLKETFTAITRKRRVLTEAERSALRIADAPKRRGKRSGLKMMDAKGLKEVAKRLEQKVDKRNARAEK